MTRSVRGLVGALSAAAVSLVLVAQLGRSHHTLDQFNALLPLLLPALAVALAAAVGLRDRVTMAVALLGLAAGGAQLGSAAMTGGRGPEDGHVVKVVTFSTFHGNPRPEALRRVIEAEQPELVLLQEADGNAREVVLKLLPAYHRIKQCPWQYCHLVILSRWPIHEAKVRFPETARRPSLLVGDVAAPFGRFRVINVHLPRPYKPEAQPAMDALAHVARSASGPPLIVAGDFNAASGSFGLARFARQSGLVRREGFVPTYPANRLAPAFVGIDHVFADARWHGGDCRRLAAAHSDHHGIVCTLRLPKRR